MDPKVGNPIQHLYVLDNEMQTFHLTFLSYRLYMMQSVAESGLMNVEDMQQDILEKIAHEKLAIHYLRTVCVPFCVGNFTVLKAPN